MYLHAPSDAHEDEHVIILDPCRVTPSVPLLYTEPSKSSIIAQCGQMYIFA